MLGDYIAAFLIATISVVALALFVPGAIQLALQHHYIASAAIVLLLIICHLFRPERVHRD